MAQSGNEGRRLPIAEGCRIDASTALWSAAIASRHVGRSPCFVNEYQLFHVHLRLRLMPCQPRRLHVLALLFAGVQRFFLKVRFHLFNWCQRAPTLTEIPCAANRSRSCSSVNPGSAAIQLRNVGSASSTRDRRWPPI